MVDSLDLRTRAGPAGVPRNCIYIFDRKRGPVIAAGSPVDGLPCGLFRLLGGRASVQLQSRESSDCSPATEMAHAGNDSRHCAVHALVYRSIRSRTAGNEGVGSFTWNS